MGKRTNPLTKSPEQIKEKHEHDYKLVTEYTLLHKYRSEEGEMKAVDTVGRDAIKMWKCACGDKIAVDITRKKV